MTIERLERMRERSNDYLEDQLKNSECFHLPLSAGITFFTMTLESLIEEIISILALSLSSRPLNFHMAPEISPMFMSGGPQVSSMESPVKVLAGKPICWLPLESESEFYNI